MGASDLCILLIKVEGEKGLPASLLGSVAPSLTSPPVETRFSQGVREMHLFRALDGSLGQGFRRWEKALFRRNGVPKSTFQHRLNPSDMNRTHSLSREGIPTVVRNLFDRGN